MISMIIKQVHKLLIYQKLLAVAGVLLFFTHLDIYLVDAKIFSSPVGFVLPYFALIAILFFGLNRKLKLPSRFILFWCLGYAIISLISYAYISESAFSLKVLIVRLLSSLFLILMTDLFNEPEVRKWTRYSILVATIAGILINFFQLFIPYLFLTIVVSRPAGFYIDPNNCGIALLFGMIFTVTMLVQEFRIPWVLVVGIGILTTQSRGAIVCWVFAFILMILTRIIVTKQLVLWILGIGLILFLVFDPGSALKIETSNSLINFTINESLTGLMDRSNLNDDGAIERQEIANKASQMFFDRPIFGYGIGATFDDRITGFSVSTHNMYLLHAAEYGALGIPLIPLVIYAVIHTARGEAKKLSIIFAGSAFLCSFFSHTILDDRDILISFALMAAINSNNQGEHIKIESTKRV
jgi:hypothetical protein